MQNEGKQQATYSANVCSVGSFWREAPWPLNIERFNDYSISNWISFVVDKNNLSVEIRKHGRDFSLFAAIAMDSIWFARNRAIHHGESPIA